MKSRIAPRRHRGGFTLLEVLIVLAIIGVIAAIAVPRYLGTMKSAQVKAAMSTIKNVEQAAQLYAVQVNNGELPTGGQEALQLLVTKGPGGEPPVMDKIPTDPWGQPLYYEYPNTKAGVDTERPAIWSSGPNKQNENGSGDDVNNWNDLLQAPR